MRLEIWGEGDGSGDIDTIARYDCHYCHWNWRVTSAAVERGLQVIDKDCSVCPVGTRRTKCPICNGLRANVSGVSWHAIWQAVSSRRRETASPY